MAAKQERRRVLPWLVAVAGIWMATACGTPPTRATTLPTADSPALRDQYQALVLQLGTASAAFNDGMAALPEPSTAEAVTVIASKFALALRAYDSGLNRLTVPTTMRINVQALLMADAALEKDLSRVAVPGFTLATWSQEITPDANRVVAASNAVRADLGLQPL